MKIQKQLLILGHPRCGSGYTANFLTKLGLKCSHENSKQELDNPEIIGLSSWAFTIDHKPGDNIKPRYGINGDGWRKNYSFKNIIVHIRDPYDAIPAIMDENNLQYTSNNWSFNIRNKYIEQILDKKIEGSELEKAILSYLYWYELLYLRRDVKFFFHIEKDHNELIKFLEDEGYKLDKNSINHKLIQDKVNSKPSSNRYKIGREEYLNIDPNILEKLNNFCQTHGYCELKSRRFK